MSVKQDIAETDAALARGELTQGAADVVPRGDETTPIKVDPMAARKAMFKKADALRGLDSAAGEEGVDPERLARLQAEARGESYVAQDDTVPDRTTTNTVPTGQSRSEYVTIPVEGGTIRVSQADIDREGSVDLYLRRRAMDEASAQDKIAIAALQRELAESNRLREQLQAQRPAGQDDPATRSASPADRNLTGSGASDQELTELADHLAEQIYSGDQNDAKAAILAILRRDRGETLSAEDIERRVRDVVAKTIPTPVTPTATVPVNPRLQAINAQIDDMAIREYPEVCQNEAARLATFAHFKELVNLPENRDRRAVDVARDACDWGQAKFFGDPRKKIVESKRGLPSSVTASGATTASSEPEAMTPSQAVAMQQAHRNFGRRIHNPQ